MLQIIHRYNSSGFVYPLSKQDLSEKRLQLKTIARQVIDIMARDGISPLSSWKKDVRSVDKEYYGIMLEQRVIKALDINISLCKSKWCAKTLLSEAFKAKKQAFSKKQKRANEVCVILKKNVANSNRLLFIPG